MNFFDKVSKTVGSKVSNMANNFFDKQFGTYDVPKEVEKEIPAEPDIFKVMEQQGLFESQLDENIQKVEESPVEEESDDFLCEGEDDTGVAPDFEDIQVAIQEKRAIFSEDYLKDVDYTKCILNQCKCRVFIREVDNSTINALKESGVVIGDEEWAKRIVAQVIDTAAQDEDTPQRIIVAVANSNALYNIVVEGDVASKSYQDKLKLFLMQFIDVHDICMLSYCRDEMQRFMEFDEPCEVSTVIIRQEDTVLYYLDVIDYVDGLRKTGAVVDLRESERDYVNTVVYERLAQEMFSKSIKYMQISDKQCIRVTVVSYVEDEYLDSLCEKVFNILKRLS